MSFPKQTTSVLGPLFALALISCIGPEQAEELPVDRAPLGKADIGGSCVDHCGGKSANACWCDNLCSSYGDCCEDKVAVCEPKRTCEGTNPAGCHQLECDDGQTCVELDWGACVPSECTCDTTTGSWDCNTDCLAPAQCVTELTCDDVNPAGCRQLGCDDGQTCVELDWGACAPGACNCDTTAGTWTCDSECFPQTQCVTELTCDGPNPAGCRELGCDDGQTCVELDWSACAPGACSCDTTAGTWHCDSECFPQTQCVATPA